jgi:hypothetical protein
VEFVAFAIIGEDAAAAAAACGKKFKVDLSVLIFEWESWDLDKVVDADAFTY